MSTDPDYLSCKKKECKKYQNGTSQCAVSTCSGSLTFHVINIRTDIEFILFSGGFELPCILKRANPLKFANPNKPLYGHLSSIDSTATAVNQFCHIYSSFCQAMIDTQDGIGILCCKFVTMNLDSI